MSQGLNYSLVCNFEKELVEIQYALDVTIDTNPERGFLNHQKHTCIDKPRVFSHFLCGKMSQMFAGRVRLKRVQYLPAITTRLVVGVNPSISTNS